jgi:hypothetical protein
MPRERWRTEGPVRRVVQTVPLFLDSNGQEIWTSFEYSYNLIRHTTVAAVKQMRSFSQWLLTRMSAGHAFWETSARVTVVGCGEMLSLPMDVWSGLGSSEDRVSGGKSSLLSKAKQRVDFATRHFNRKQQQHQPRTLHHITNTTWPPNPHPAASPRRSPAQPGHHPQPAHSDSPPPPPLAPSHTPPSQPH